MTTTDVTEEELAIQAQRQEVQQAAMRAAGVDPEQSLEIDYFAFDDVKQVPLPGSGTQYVEISVLNEGARRKYLNKVNREVKVNQVTKDMSTKLQPGDERFELLSAAITGWHVLSKNRTGEMLPVPFDKVKLADFLDKANPKVIDVIEKEVRKQNPWLLAELSVEDIEKQIEELTEMLQTKKEEEAGKSVSSS